MAGSARKSQLTQLTAVMILAGWLPTAGLSQDHRLDEMSLERWSKMRETERYQLNIGEKYYREKNWKVAASEYEKYLTLYETSDAGSFAQLKWSICQVHLRKENTAIKEGFQSVVDYWPDSPDAVVATYYMGSTYKKIGRLPQAKKAYRTLLSKHPKQMAAVFAMVDLIDISTVEKDEKTRIELWKRLTFDTPRAKYTAQSCIAASRSLAVHHFGQAAFDDGVKALATSYNEQQLPAQVVAYARAPLAALVAQSESKAKGEKLADRIVSYLKESVPQDIAEDAAKQQAMQLWFSVADIESTAARFDRVPDVYDEMVKKFGVDDSILSKLATWQKSQKLFDDARTTYRRFEDKVEGLNQVAYSYREERNYDSAISVYQQLIGLDAENTVRWKGELAATYRAIPKYEEAIGIYTQLSTEDLDRAATWRWYVANAYRDWGKLKEAIGHYRQCTNFPENYKQMAACHRSLKEYNEALLLYNQIVGGHPGSAAWAMLQVAYTREQAGQKEPAIKAFQAVCKRFPKDGHASVAHAHLQNKYKISVTLGGAKDQE